MAIQLVYEVDEIDLTFMCLRYLCMIYVLLYIFILNEYLRNG